MSKQELVNRLTSTNEQRHILYIFSESDTVYEQQIRVTSSQQGHQYRSTDTSPVIIVSSAGQHNHNLCPTHSLAL